jgi:hypothetical protein
MCLHPVELTGEPAWFRQDRDVDDAHEIDRPVHLGVRGSPPEKG